MVASTTFFSRVTLSQRKILDPTFFISVAKKSDYLPLGYTLRKATV